MSTDVLQPMQSELMNRQLVVASSSHRTSMSIHTVCIWQHWFQRVHKGWKNTAWQGACHIPVHVYKGLEEDPTQTSTVPFLKCCCSSLLSPQPFHLKENHLSLKDRQKESILGWSWNGAQATCGAASRTPRPPQHRVALGGCQPNSAIGGSKSKL